MALLSGTPQTAVVSFWSYTHTNPLRREAGLRLLTEPLPESLRWAIIRAWRPPHPAGTLQAELPSLHRQRPAEASLPGKPPYLLGLIALVELEMGQRIVEAPLASISPVTRNRLLSAQGAYLRCLYAALAAQVGEAAAQSEFQRLILQIR
ncbi:MAG TPA: hypothetical protein VFU69_04740 [Ktedonobacterales bacterium]|nr:hypothetical protein [Ktedonobacterales bacterium]